MTSLTDSIKTLWRFDKLHFFLIAYFVLVYSWMYRVALRSIMEGADFRWVTVINTRMLEEQQRAFIAGNGTDGHFIIVLLLAMFFSALLYLLIRRPDNFCKSLFLGWAGIFLLHQFTVAIGLGTDYVIRGDTIGLVLPFYIIGPAQHLLMLGLAILWAIKPTSNQLCCPVLEPGRKKLLGSLLALYPVLFLLFRMGVQDGLSDKVGIVLFYLQTGLLIFALFHFQIKETRDELA